MIVRLERNSPDAYSYITLLFTVSLVASFAELSSEFSASTWGRSCSIQLFKYHETIFLSVKYILSMYGFPLIDKLLYMEVSLDESKSILAKLSI